MSLTYSDNLPPQPMTDVFTSDTCIDRRQCHRTVPMKVLALGVGRTGTASLRIALERLGYLKCYHMMSASVENPPDCLMWHDALLAKYDGIGEFGRKEWDQLLGDCQVSCDKVWMKGGENAIETNHCSLFRPSATGLLALLQRSSLRPTPMLRLSYLPVMWTRGMRMLLRSFYEEGQTR